MKKYVIFGGSNYYPYGGWGDFIASFNTLAEAIENIARRDELCDWIHIVELESGSIVWKK